MNVLNGIYYILQLFIKSSRMELFFLHNKNQDCWHDVPAKTEWNAFDSFKTSEKFDI